MQLTRGIIELIDDNYYWCDRFDKRHLLQNMEDSYVKNCVSLLDKRLERNKDPEVATQTVKNKIILLNELQRREFVKKTSVGRLLYV